MSKVAKDMKEPAPKQRLTFEIDGPRITAQRFKAGFTAFLDIANEVANDVAGKQRALDGIITVEPGSVRVDPFEERRVAASGLIAYRADGAPVNIELECCDLPFPPE